MDLMSLLVRIGADVSGAQKGIAAVQSSMTDAAKQSDSFSSKLSGAFKKVGVATAGLAAAVTAAGAAVIKLTTNAAAATDRIDKMSQKIGISRQSFQEMDFIMSQSGGSVESLQIGMKTLRTTMVNATKGGKDQAAMFKKLGVSLKDTGGKMRSQEDVMFDTLSALQKVGDETQRTAMATELFGKAGIELVPLLNSGAGSIDEMKKKAHELGLVLDDDAIDMGVKLTDTIDQVKRSFEAVKTRIGVSLMPVVQKILNIVLKNMPKIQSILGTFFKVLGGLVDGAVTVLGWLGDKVSGIFGGVGDVVQGIVDKISGFVGLVVGAFKNQKNNAGFADAGDFWAYILTGGNVKWINGFDFNTFADKFIRPVVSKLLNTLFGSDEATDKVMEIIKNLGNGIQSAWSGVKTFFTVTIPDAAKTLWDSIKQLWDDMEPFRAFIAGALAAAWNSIKTFFTTTIPNAATTLWDGMKQLWDDLEPFRAFIAENFKQAWTGIVNFFTLSLPNAVKDLWTGLKQFWDNTEDFRAFIADTFLAAWQSIKDYWTDDLQPKLAELLEAFNNFKTTVLEPIATFVAGTFKSAWEGIKSLFGGEDGVESSVNSVAEVLTTIHDNVLKPIATFLIGTFAAAWRGVRTIASTLITTFTALMDEVITPLYDFLKDKFIEAWKSLKEYWADNLLPRLSGLVNAFTTFKDTVLKPIAAFLSETFTAAWTAITSLFGGEDGEGGVTGSVSSLADAFSALWNNVLKPVVTWLADTFGTAWTGVEGILSGLVTFLTGVFSADWKTAWEGLVEMVSAPFNALKEILKKPINAVIDLINGLIDKVQNGINTIIGGINSALSINIPSFQKKIWNPFGEDVTIGFPGYSWSPGIGKIDWSGKHIEKLAHGGVLGEGGTAIVGEYAPEYLRVVNGRAIVTPMSDKPGRFGGEMNVTFNITQQPGESAEHLAEIIQREFVRMEKQRMAYA